MRLNERFEYDPVTDLLGVGGFGKVYKASDTMLQREVVLKMVQKSKLPDRYDLVSEIRRIIRYRHTNLVEFYDVFTKPMTDLSGAPDELQVGVMEYINGGSLKELIGQKPNLPTIEVLLTGVLKGLAYLHQNGIIHRDIKPSNILIEKTELGELIAKITDFNISKQIHSEVSSISSVIGTFEYMSPEQLGKGDGKIGIAADIWSFGAMVYEIFTGETPFGSRKNGDTDSVIITNILSKLDLDKIENIPIPYRGIVIKCLEKNPTDRFADCSQILFCINEATQLIDRSNLTDSDQASVTKVKSLKGMPKFKTDIATEDRDVKKKGVENFNPWDITQSFWMKLSVWNLIGGIAIFFVIVFAILSSLTETDRSSVSPITPQPNLSEIKDPIKDYYIVNLEATGLESVAKEEVRKFVENGYPAKYLWIPDYPSLGTNQYYLVYLGTYDSQERCEVEVEKYNMLNPNREKVYGSLISSSGKRLRIDGIGKFNGNLP